MSTPAHAEHDRASTPPHAGTHATVATYVKVAVILTVITVMEVAVIYMPFLAPIIVPLLLTMSAAKFALVALFFMHLRYDRRALSALFVGPLVIAAALLLALVTLPGAFLLFKR